VKLRKDSLNSVNDAPPAVRQSDVRFRPSYSFLLISWNLCFDPLSRERERTRERERKREPDERILIRVRHPARIEFALSTCLHFRSSRRFLPRSSLQTKAHFFFSFLSLPFRRLATAPIRRRFRRRFRFNVNIITSPVATDFCE